MPLPIPFTKYSGCGNDFVLVDNRQLNIVPNPSKIAQLCHRQKGIGADGIIFLELSKHAACRMRIFNADGSEAEMCGNGLRCLARYIHSKEPISERFTVETKAGIFAVFVKNELVSVTMPPPQNVKYHQKLVIDGITLALHTLDTGVPHAVIFVEDIEDSQHLAIAPKIRFHSNFQPRGTNVNFAKILADNSVSVRTYERGVEQETLACGTGAVAVAVAVAQIHKLPTPITICTRSTECIQVDFSKKSEITEIILETAVQDDKVMQDFELESLSMGGDHSQWVKTPPIESDSGSKDCVNLSSSTAVSRIIMTGPAVKVFEGTFSNPF